MGPLNRGPATVSWRAPGSRGPAQPTSAEGARVQGQAQLQAPGSLRGAGRSKLWGPKNPPDAWAPAGSLWGTGPAGPFQLTYRQQAGEALQAMGPITGPWAASYAKALGAAQRCKLWGTETQGLKNRGPQALGPARAAPFSPEGSGGGGAQRTRGRLKLRRPPQPWAQGRGAGESFGPGEALQAMGLKNPWSGGLWGPFNRGPKAEVAGAAL